MSNGSGIPARTSPRDAVGEAQRFEAFLDELASAFAHELKQPLGASLINAQTALKLLEASPPDLAEVRAALEDIAEDNQRAGKIVDDLRRFLRGHWPKLAADASNRPHDD